MSDLISIIVPCYNQAQYLDECLNSVLNQTYNSWECIIVNDGSTDETEDIAQQWVNKDNRFKYYFKENGGLSDTRNYGINKAEGNYILPLDADDYIGLDLLKLSIAAYKKYEDITIVYSKVMNFGTVNGLNEDSNFEIEKFLLRNQISCTAMYKKDDYQKTKGYDVNLKYGSEDWDFWLSILDNNTFKVIELDYIGIYYRRKEQSMIVDFQSNKDKICYTHNYIFHKHCELYNKYYGDPIMAYSKLNYLEQKVKPILKALNILRKLNPFK